MKAEQRHNQRQGDGDDNQQRQPPVFHEQEKHQTGQHRPHVQVLFQIVYGVRQQSGLVARQVETDIRIFLPQVFHQPLDALLQIFHLRVVLFDDGHRHGILPVVAHQSCPRCQFFFHTAQVFQLHQTAFVVDIHILNVLPIQQLRIEMDVVTVQPVYDGKRPERDIVRLDGLGQGFHIQPHRQKFRFIRDANDFRSRRTGYIHHGRLR